MAPADGQREWGREQGRADLPAGLGTMSSWQVPFLLPKETRSEEAALWAGVAEALGQGLHAHWA